VHAIASLQAVPTAATCRTNERLVSSHVYQRQVASGAGGAGASLDTHPRESASAAPGTQASVPVQHAPSSHAASDGGWDAAPAAHASSVHAIPSSGTSVSSTTCSHPPLGSQASRVHGLPSSQSIGAPPVHTPAMHCSPTTQADVAQAVPSATGVETHVPPTNASSVHGLPSLHSGT